MSKHAFLRSAVRLHYAISTRAHPQRLLNATDCDQGMRRSLRKIDPPLFFVKYAIWHHIALHHREVVRPLEDLTASAASSATMRPILGKTRLVFPRAQASGVLNRTRLPVNVEHSFLNEQLLP